MQNEIPNNEWHHVVTIEDLGNLKNKINITYDTEGVRMALDKACENIIPLVQIKGFRKGKAPKPLIYNYFKKEISESASKMLEQEGFLHACYEQKIQPLGKPEVETSNFNIDGSFNCSLLIDVKPKIVLSGYLGLSLTKPQIDKQNIYNNLKENIINSNMIEQQIEQVEEKSTVLIDYTVEANGEKTVDEKDYKVEIRKNSLPPFGENLIGKNVGEQFVVETDLPTKENEEVRLSNVNIMIKSIFNQVKPTDEELCIKINLSKEELEEQLSNQTNKEFESKNRQIIEEQAVDKLIDLHTFEVPSKWVEDEKNYIIQQLGLKNNMSTEIDGYLNKMSERNVKRSFILEEIYEEEKSLKVTEEELNIFLEKESSQMNISPIELKKQLQEQKMFESVFAVIKHKKVMDFVLNNASIRDENE